MLCICAVLRSYPFRPVFLYNLLGNAFTPYTVNVTGCSLKADKKEHKVEVDDDEAEHQLSLKAVR